MILLATFTVLLLTFGTAEVARSLQS